MEFYTFMRQLADSWALVGLAFAFFMVFVVIIRPGASALQSDAANIPLRDDNIDRDIPSATATQTEDAK